MYTPSGALSSDCSIHIVDLKQFHGLEKTKMVMYSTSLKLNSTSKLTARDVSKNYSFTFSVKNDFRGTLSVISHFLISFTCHVCGYCAQWFVFCFHSL